MTKNLNLWAIPLLPLVGAAINGLLGHRFKNAMVSAIALLFTAASFAWAAWAPPAVSLRLLVSILTSSR